MFWIKSWQDTVWKQNHFWFIHPCPVMTLKQRTISNPIMMALYPSHNSLPAAFAENYFPKACFISFCSHPLSCVNVHGRVCPSCLLMQPLPTEPTLQHSIEFESLPFARDIWILIWVKTGTWKDHENVLALFGMLHQKVKEKLLLAWIFSCFWFQWMLTCYPGSLSQDRLSAWLS